MKSDHAAIRVQLKLSNNQVSPKSQLNWTDGSALYDPSFHMKRMLFKDFIRIITYDTYFYYSLFVLFYYFHLFKLHIMFFYALLLSCNLHTVNISVA